MLNKIKLYSNYNKKVGEILLIRKSIINSRNFVPKYFGNNREFQVFLKAVDLAFSVIKSDTDNFVANLLDPLKCKARLLPLLSNYVGWDYKPNERVLTNRWITKLYPILVRNRGNEIGITLAIAMSICLLGDPEKMIYEKSFSMEYDYATDKYGRKIKVLKIYMYNDEYYSILHDLIETVRPAGIKVEYISSQSISSSETIALTDEYNIAKYDYITGKLLSINDINIYVQNSWPLLIDIQAIKHYKWNDLKNFVWGPVSDEKRKELLNDDVQVMSDNTWGYYNDTGIEQYISMPGLAPYDVPNNDRNNMPTLWDNYGIYLIDGKFYDRYNNYLGRYVDDITGNILYDNVSNSDEDNWRGEFIKETRIYKKDKQTGEIVYTGMYFDVSEPAKILNTYYKLLDDNVFSGFFLSKDDLHIYNSENMTSNFKLQEEIMTINDISTLVWKVYSSNGSIKYNWHVDMISRKFIMDDDGQEISTYNIKSPFSESTYIGKKAYLANVNNEENQSYLVVSSYYVNPYGDIVDQAGNIILSKKDRYKISDSTMIGFSEIHDESKELSTYDGTNILAREWSFMNDDQMEDIHGRESSNVNDNYEYDRVTDSRIKITYDLFKIGNPVREYTGSELIRFLSNDDLKQIKNVDGLFKIPLFVTNFDSENARDEFTNDDAILQININTSENLSLGDIFNNISIKFENKIPNNELNPKWNIILEWTANKNNNALFNLNDLENPIKFLKCGIIEPRTLHWTMKPIYITPKVYDGTVKVYTDNQNIK